MKTFKKIAIVAALVPSFAMAATDGNLGATSSGTLDIDAVIPSLVRISGMSDISLGSFDGSTALSGSSNACIYRNGAGNYEITASSSNGANFNLLSGSDSLGYAVSFDNGSGSAVPMTAGTALTGVSGANTSSTSCGGGSNAVVSVDISALGLQGAPAGTYTDTLTLVVAPE